MNKAKKPKPTMHPCSWCIARFTCRIGGIGGLPVFSDPSRHHNTHSQEVSTRKSGVLAATSDFPRGEACVFKTKVIWRGETRFKNEQLVPRNNWSQCCATECYKCLVPFGVQRSGTDSSCPDSANWHGTSRVFSRVEDLQGATLRNNPLRARWILVQY